MRSHVSAALLIWQNRGRTSSDPSHPTGRCIRQTPGAPTLLTCQPFWGARMAE